MGRPAFKADKTGSAPTGEHGDALVPHLFTSEEVNLISALLHDRTSDDPARLKRADDYLTDLLGRHGCTTIEFEAHALAAWRSHYPLSWPPLAAAALETDMAAARCAGCRTVKRKRVAYEMRELPMGACCGSTLN